jgi:Domain of Unknown Function (DUF1080)
MRYFTTQVIAFLITASGIGFLSGLTSALQAQDGVRQPPAGFTALFNGKDLEGWHGRPHLDPRNWATTEQPKREEWNKDIATHWTVKNGALVNDGHGAYLTTNKEYGDIDLYIDYKTVAKADSGIYLRGSPQVQIWDSTEEAKFNLGANKGSGALWNNSPGTPGKDPLVLADKPFGQWNTLRIVQVGARTSVWLNDKLVVDHAIMENFFDRAQPLFEKGVIQLQTHGGEIQWRNIFIKELSSDEANAWLRARSPGNFVSLFNGKDLSGWKGAIDNYEVVDAAIQCKSGKGGVLHTEKEIGVSASPRRKQWTGYSLPRRRRYRLRWYVRIANTRQQLRQVRQAR